jgi:predicted transcriptional regulator
MNVEISAYQVKFDNEKHRSIYYRQPKRGFNIETIGNAMLRVVTIRLAIEEKRAALRKLEAQLSEAAQRINDDVPEDMKDKIKITSRHKLAVTVFCESEEQAREVMDRSKHVLRIFTNETYSV